MVGSEYMSATVILLPFGLVCFIGKFFAEPSVANC